MDNEIWKDIKGFEGLYQVSNLGRVKSVEHIVNDPLNGTRTVKERILSSEKMKCGYLRTALSKDSKMKKVLTHRLVAETFIPNSQNKPQVNHIDGNKKNNAVSNLEWCNNSENILHADKTGLRDMKKLYKRCRCIETGEIFESIKAAGKFVGMTPTQISSACKGKRNTVKGFHFEYI